MKRVLNILAKVPVAIAILAIRAYQVLISPLLVGGGCRHFPTCSEYAIEALRVHGLLHGGMMALRRLVRCRPGGTVGYDPVAPPRPTGLLR